MVTFEPTWGVHGSTAAVERMRRAVEQGPRHAYLLSGPDHIGKATLATAFAAALLCPNPPEPGEPCRECSTCRRVFRGVHPDVSRYDLEWQASQDESSSKNLTLNIKTIRAISRHVALRPAEARWRVIVVDDVETMQETAQEAFLKTVEEPPSFVVILMLCTDAELLLPTILSRCSIVPMAPATDAVVANALTAHGADDDVASRIAIAVRGRVGLALRAQDDESLLEVMSGHVSESVSWIAGDAYARVVAAFQLADRYSAEREMVFDRLMATQAAWRELLIAATEAPTAARHPILDSVAVPPVESSLQAIVAIDRCIRDLEANVRPRAALATMVQAWPELGE